MAEYHFSSVVNAWVKECTGCAEIYIGDRDEDVALKQLSKYFASDKYKPDGFYSRCRNCVAKYNQANREGRICDPDALLAAQDGKCAICQDEIGFKRKAYTKTTAYVDHNHDTNTVRGLLCHRCNSLLGVVEDKVWLTAALVYLEKHREDN